MFLKFQHELGGGDDPVSFVCVFCLFGGVVCHLLVVTL